MDAPQARGRPTTGPLAVNNTCPSRVRCVLSGTALTHVTCSVTGNAAKEAIIAAQQPDSVPEDTARSLLSQGYGVDNVAARTGLSADTVARIADTIDRPDVSALVTAVHERLHDLGISQLAASKIGKLSRSTLATLGKAGKVPSDTTLAKLDELLSWEPGSARSTMFRTNPSRGRHPTDPSTPPSPTCATATTPAWPTRSNCGYANST